jgi:NAD(P)-dependent dehydrogenase (short-subunit alcohol dehydrogenase family)
MAKYFASEMSERVTSEALQILGGAGCTTRHPMERYWRDARLTKIFEGTSEIQQRIISDSPPGKPTRRRSFLTICANLPSRPATRSMALPHATHNRTERHEHAAKPLNSGFGPGSTAMAVIAGRDLHGKTAIVTGGHSGIGLETSRALSSAGATLYVGSRDVARARHNLAGIPGVEVFQLDLADPESIDRFVSEFLETKRDLDILINNAGVSGPPDIKDSRGFDTQFATNHLGHFQMTVGLRGALKASGHARMVALSSVGHMTGGIDFDDIQFDRRPYDKLISYGQSKSACALFAVQLDKLGAKHGIRAFAAHPGAVSTDLGRYMTQEELDAWGIVRGDDGKLIMPAGFKTAEQGAATSIWCATSPQLEGLGSLYCEDCDVARAVPADLRN